MNNVYIIVVSKRNKKMPVIGEFLKNIFTITWNLASDKTSETWLVGRDISMNINDITSAIKCLDKKIDGVFVSRITLTESCWDNNGVFDIKYVSADRPSANEMIRRLMNKT